MRNRSSVHTVHVASPIGTPHLYQESGKDVSSAKTLLYIAFALQISYHLFRQDLLGPFAKNIQQRPVVQLMFLLRRFEVFGKPFNGRNSAQQKEKPHHFFLALAGLLST